MLNKTPIVTILMPVFNGEKYLPEAIESILNQTFTDFEFLIIDDFSTDNSINVIKKYKDKRIRLIINEQNMGQTITLNKGLKLACGKFIARMDQDDISHQSRLEKQVSFLLKNTDFALVGSFIQFINHKGDFVKNYNPPTNHDEIINSFVYRNPFAHSSLLFRKDLIMSLGAYSLQYKYVQDFSLLIKITSHYKVANIPHTLTKIRLHQDQSTSSFISKKLNKWEQYSIHKELYSHPNISGKLKKILYNSIIFLKTDYLWTKWQQEKNNTDLLNLFNEFIDHPTHFIKFFGIQFLYKINDPGLTTKFTFLKDKYKIYTQKS